MGLARFAPLKRVDLEHEPDQHVEIRKLNGRQLRKVRKAATSEGIAQAREMGADMMVALRSIDDEKAAQVRAAMANPLQGYDIDLLLEFSIVQWSYDAEVNADNIGDLDEPTREAIALAAVAYSANVRTEDETKNS